MEILIAEDDPTLRAFLETAARDEGYDTVAVGSGDEAVGCIARRKFDVVLTDVRLPGKNGLEVLKEARRRDPHCEVIVMSAFATVEMAVEAMKEGACDFLQKPFTNETVESLLERIARRLKSEKTALAAARAEQTEIVGLEKGLREVNDLIERVAPSDSSVLLLGESGVGKELIAREIHRRSPRAAARLVSLHISAIPSHLVEAELFGHEKGAFTGAMKSREGLLELADGGTIFLDEIGDLAPEIQVKLLRFLQERSFRRVGGNREIHVDVRILAATHRDLARDVEERRFRRDLYYRLNVVPIHIPPLRERTEDIPELVAYFLRKYSISSRPVTDVSPRVLETYLRYPWPGNVRELENVISRAAILSRGPLLEEPFLDGESPNVNASLPEWFPGSPLPDFLEEIERGALKKALDISKGNKAEAARLLGVKRTTFVEKLNRYGIK
ncbi:MAG: sigma-54-dependent Fis family transcriptional regulator [Candidatus Hydrogenedentota bacterium]|nr:MAG: sigma-54-dependent Fis family transcriptional regulator [Candidatus Hydrogenedentota bacterium]